MPIPVALLAEAQVCSRLSAGIAGSNPAESMVIRLLCSLCVVMVLISATG